MGGTKREEKGRRYLIDRSNLGREAPMHAEHLPVNQSSKVEVIKDVHTVLPGIGVPVLPHAFFVEAIDLQW